MDYFTFSLAVIPICSMAIFVLLLIHVILSERHNRRAEHLEQQILEQLNGKQLFPTYTWKSTPTHNTPVPTNNK